MESSLQKFLEEKGVEFCTTGKEPYPVNPNVNYVWILEYHKSQLGEAWPSNDGLKKKIKDMSDQSKPDGVLDTCIALIKAQKVELNKLKAEKWKIQAALKMGIYLIKFFKDPKKMKDDESKHYQNIVKVYNGNIKPVLKKVGK